MPANFGLADNVIGVKIKGQTFIESTADILARLQALPEDEQDYATFLLTDRKGGRIEIPAARFFDEGEQLERGF